MRLKRLLAFVIALAMVMGIAPTVSIAFADDSQVTVARVGETEYSSLALAVAEAGEAYVDEPVEVTLLADSNEDFTLDFGIVELVTGNYDYTGTVAVNNALLIADCELEEVVCTAKAANSDETKFGYTSMTIGVEMVDGAQVRIGEGADAKGKVVGEESGLRFIATVNRIDTLAGIAYEFYNSETSNYAADYQIGVKIMAEGSSEEVAIPATRWQSEGEVFTIALTNLAESNYNRRFNAAAYVEIEGIRFENDAYVTRSIYQVAAGLLADGEAEANEMSQALVNVLNAYVNQTGVRLTLTDSTADASLKARMGSENGAYTGQAFFTVGDTVYRNGMYQVTLKAIGKSVINTELFNEYVRINNNNTKVSPVTGIRDNGDGTYTVTFDYADMPNGSGVINEPVTLTNGDIIAYVPAGVAFSGSADKLKLVLKSIDDENSEVEAGDGEELDSFDIHVNGVTEDNTTPIIITLTEVAEKGLNRGNLKLYHVEDGVQVEMEQVDSVEELTKHNQFTYEPLDGTIVVALASFSEIALVAEEDKAWKGKYDYSWYDADATELTIANADQLAAFSAIVGGMNNQKQDSFAGKTVKLTSDINLGNAEGNKVADKIFYPIGYYNSTGSYEKTSGVSVTSGVKSFEGTFDGNGHTIKNIYQNTWEMFGDYNSGYSGTPNHYQDAMGLFGYVVNGIVKNLTVDNFSSDGEFTPTGVIAAYAVNSTFENIAITNCNPRVYNTGNGGIVGIGGNSDDPDTYNLKFTNITIDNSNKITALWGSWDVACGGLVGMFRGAGHANMTNCHVAAQIDVYNDVCGNYQYYWYRYAGMMIGTNKSMTTDANGYTVPETDKFHAENCTVHFGEWNDYYYCELVANSLASYTHDHQFSRLEQVDSVDVANMKVTTTVDGKEVITDIPTSGRYNYVVVDVEGEPSTSNASCYHFVDGAVWNHADAGKETVDGVEVLKEDKQHIYLPFNQLFTGYGWGVKHVPVYNGENYAFEGITILDREKADSVEKFAEADTAKDSYTTGTTVTIGELFEATGASVAIDTANVNVFVSPVGEESTAGGAYVAGTTDWTQGTLTLSGEGKATITITDYYFCTPTTIEVNIIERVATEKFEIVFPNTKDYLYRVGNQNAVALSRLFKAIDGAEIGNVTVTVEAVNGASGTYTPNATWANGTIRFSGTGVVKATITDNDYCTPTELYLEVVNATNVTDYSGLKNTNSVLLSDITMTSGGSYYLSGATLYGNGFTFDVSGGAYSGTGSVSNNYLVSLNNANLDNVKIVGAVYTEYGAEAANNYNRPTVLSVGNNTITNSYISNCAAPVRVRDGNIEIINTTLKGGNFANLDIRNGHVVLDNVTTINQVNGNDKTKDGTVVVGLGVVVYYENVLETTTVEVKNGITQHNHLSKTQANTYITNTNAKQLVNAMFGTGNANLQYSADNDTWVNTGIISMTENIAENNISNVNGYLSEKPEFLGKTGYVHTKVPTADSVEATVADYVTAGQYAIAPEYSFDYTTKNYVAKVDGSNDYCYEENGVVNISMDEGDYFNWDTAILTATKNGQTLDYTVSMNGTDYTGKNIAFNTAGEYTVIYTYTDSNNYTVDGNGGITAYSKTYTKTVHVSVAVIEPSAKNAEFTMGSSNAATEKITIDNVTYVSATGVTADNSTWTYITINGQKVYYPIVAAKLTSTKGSSTYAYFPVFENVVTITDYADNGTGDAFTYNSSTTTLPSTLTAVKGIYKAASDVPYWYNLTNSNLTQIGASKIFKWASSSEAPSDPTTYNNNVLYYKSPQISADRAAYITLVQYSYTDATNTTYYYYVGYTLEAFTKQTTCVTPDTLVTLADGSQKRIDSLEVGEMLKVWDFETGEYTVAPVAVLRNHGLANNTVITMEFDNGIVTKIVNEHGYYDAEARRFVAINGQNAESYVGHSFVIETEDGYDTAVLEKVTVEEKEVEAWSVLTAYNYNFITDSVFSITSSVGGLEYFMPYENDENLKIDAAKKQADIEKYGLFTYEELAYWLTEEQFELLNASQIKVSVGKGYITMEEFIHVIEVEVLGK